MAVIRARDAMVLAVALCACGDLPAGVVKHGSGDDPGPGRQPDAASGTASTTAASGTTSVGDGGPQTDDVGETAGAEPCDGVELPGGIVPRYPSATRTVPGLGFESIDVRSPKTTCDGYEALRCHESGFGWTVEIRLATLTTGVHVSGAHDVGAYGECWTGTCGGTTAIVEDCTPLTYVVEIYEVTDTCVAGRIDFTPALEREGDDPIDQLHFLAPRCDRP